MNNKEKIFFFPSLGVKHFLFLFFFLISILKKVVQTFFEKNRSLAWDFFVLYLYDIGDILSIIPYLIIKKRTKAVKNSIIDNNNINAIDNNDINNNNNINIKNTNITILYYDPEDKTNKYRLYLKIFIISIVDFIAQISKLIFYIIIEEENLHVDLDDQNSILLFYIISTIIFSKLMLHDNFFKHHYFSILIDLLCLIILSIMDFIEIDKKNKNNLLIPIIYLFIKIFKYILYSFSNVLDKIIFLYDFVSPYALLLIKAIIQFFYLVIFSVPFVFKKLKDDNDGIEKTIFSMISIIFENKNFIMVSILYTINSFFYNIVMLQIINTFSPNHFIVAKIFEYIGIFIIGYIIRKEKEELEEIYLIIIKIIIFVLLIFASFIFNEYLVINICGLAKKTKLFLDYEAGSELSNKKEDESINSDFSKDIPLIKESDIY